ncbi:MAG: biotin--[acetyl-CoA-carboxylase] ligase [Planctomycetia bacterium]|nr:biotin--[acetyl-CoA-carboxylase] ligase [Planctomycetia bacterium]
MPPDPIDPHVIRRDAGIATFEHLAVVDTTMERARELAADPCTPLPAAVVADRQERGRGRRGARWWQPEGSLVASLVLDAASAGGGVVRPTWSLACGVALAEAVMALEPTIAAGVRWPNDVEVDGGKLAGILVEATPGGRVVFGVGVNTTGSAAQAPPEIGQAVRTVPDLVGRTIPRALLLCELVPRLRGLLAGMSRDESLLPVRYRPLCTLTGRDVTVYRGLEAGMSGDRVHGLCLGIDRRGALVLETTTGRLHVESGTLSDPSAAWRGPDGG